MFSLIFAFVKENNTYWYFFRCCGMVRRLESAVFENWIFFLQDSTKDKNLRELHRPIQCKNSDVTKYKHTDAKRISTKKYIILKS